MLGYAPDLPESAPSVLVDVDAFPTTRGYKGPPSSVSAGFPALAAACNGAALVTKLDGTTRLFAGTQSKLYEGSGATWTDVSRAGSYTTGDTKWRFAQSGNTSLAISKLIQLQSSASGAFANVANAPKAALMETVGDFVMLANCDDTGTGLATGYGDQTNRWWCGQIYNPTGTWAPNTSLQCTSGLLVASPGACTGLKRLGSQVVVYKARSMYLGTYVGPPSVWDFSLIPGEIGVANNEAVVSIGTQHLFIGFEDFYSFDGSRPIPIGAGIKEFFFADLNKTYAYRIEGIHDFVNKCVWWFYPSAGSTTNNSAIIYSYETQRWGRTTKAIECPVSSVTSAVTYDGLPALFPTYGDLPAVSYDSPLWQSGAPILSIIDSTHTLQTLTGVPTSWYIQTGFLGDDAAVSTCTRVRPRYTTKPTAAAITSYSVMALGDSPTMGASSSINGNRFDVLQSARWHQFKLAMTGNGEIEDIKVDLTAAGYE